MKRFFACLVSLLMLVACTSQKGKVDPPPSQMPAPVPTASLSPHLVDWNGILQIFADAWRSRLDAKQFKLEVIAAPIVEPAQLHVCAQAPQFNHSASFLAYCRAASGHPPSSSKGVVLIPHDRFMNSLALLRGGASEQAAYETVVVLLALFYADHLISQAQQVGLLPKDKVKEHHRYCLAGGVVRTSAPENRVSLVKIYQTLRVAVPFVQRHRTAVPPRAADWLSRGLNSGGRLELDNMCV